MVHIGPGPIGVGWYANRTLKQFSPHLAKYQSAGFVDMCLKMPEYRVRWYRESAETDGYGRQRNSYFSNRLPLPLSGC